VKGARKGEKKGENKRERKGKRKGEKERKGENDRKRGKRGTQNILDESGAIISKKASTTPEISWTRTISNNPDTNRKERKSKKKRRENILICILHIFQHI
jgi:hypothetical protein